MNSPTKRASIWIWLVLAFFVASFLLLNKGDIFSLASDIEDYLKVVPLWFAVAVLFYLLISSVFKDRLAGISKPLYYSIVGICALVHWSMIKFDPRPYSGAVDTIMKRDLIERSAAASELERVNGSQDSTIMYVYSVDTTENGVYIWLHGKKVLLRRFSGGDQVMHSDLDKEAIKQLKDTISLQ